MADPGSFKLTDMSYRLRFSFVSFVCIVLSFFVFRSLAFCSCNWLVRFVYHSFRSSVSLSERTKRNTNERYTKRTINKVRGCAMLPDWTILLIALRENIFNKFIFSIIYSTDK